MKVENVKVVGRRWFRKGPGTTYHSAEIYVNGELVHKIHYAYGYNDQYEWNAADWLEANGYMPGRERHTNYAESPYTYFERMGVPYAAAVTDVKRKKHL